MKERISTINEILEYGNYFFADPVNYDEKGLSKHWTSDFHPYFKKFVIELKNINEWTSIKIEEYLRVFAENEGQKAAPYIHVLRLSLTGRSVSPGIFEVMEILGKDTVLKRITVFVQKN